MSSHLKEQHPNRHLNKLKSERKRKTRIVDVVCEDIKYLKEGLDAVAVAIERGNVRTFTEEVLFEKIEEVGGMSGISRMKVYQALTEDASIAQLVKTWHPQILTNLEGYDLARFVREEVALDDDDATTKKKGFLALYQVHQAIVPSIFSKIQNVRTAKSASDIVEKIYQEVVVTTLEDVVSIAEVVVSIEKEEDGIQDVKEVIIPISTLVEVEVEVEVIIPTKI
ncbi:hypothetical protein M9H77_12949 [Catharanthus roseus]|uniref:Uncharacterized protein n=1 Tax=Catharanthus roseus TaxID=4058 RepID=A0ACC0BIY4_CATRO|nr:hypothetical protein M9H77_12949 [Catharanthus roseus]